MAVMVGIGTARTRAELERENAELKRLLEESRRETDDAICELHKWEMTHMAYAAGTLGLALGANPLRNLRYCIRYVRAVRAVRGFK